MLTAVPAARYAALLRHPPSEACCCCGPSAGVPAVPSRSGSVASDVSSASAPPLSRQEKFSLLRLLPAFMVPLGVVYFAEYFINQGLVELIWFRSEWLLLLLFVPSGPVYTGL